ncbi:hypothetical protein D9M69_435630 [compost metagenome]
MSDAHLKLLTKLEELDAYTHAVLHQFPKLERHLLCAELRSAVGGLLRLTIVAWKRKQKAAALFDLDVEIEVCRGLIRKAHRLKYISTERLGVWMRHVNEIGCIVGAWIKHEDQGKQGR